MIRPKIKHCCKNKKGHGPMERTCRNNCRWKINKTSNLRYQGTPRHTMVRFIVYIYGKLSEGNVKIFTVVETHDLCVYMKKLWMWRKQEKSVSIVTWHSVPYTYSVRDLAQRYVHMCRIINALSASEGTWNVIDH